MVNHLVQNLHLEGSIRTIWKQNCTLAQLEQLRQREDELRKSLVTTNKETQLRRINQSFSREDKSSRDLTPEKLAIRKTELVKHHPFLQAAVGEGLPTQVPELVDLLHQEFSVIADHLETTRQQHWMFRKDVDTQTEKVHNQLFSCGEALEDLHHRSTRLETGIQEAKTGIHEAKTGIHEIRSEQSKAQEQARASDAQAKTYHDEVLRCLTGGSKPVVLDASDPTARTVTLDAGSLVPRMAPSPVSFTMSAGLSHQDVGRVQGSTRGDPETQALAGNREVALRPTYAAVADPTYRSGGDSSGGPMTVFSQRMPPVEMFSGKKRAYV